MNGEKQIIFSAGIDTRLLKLLIENARAGGEADTRSHFVEIFTFNGSTVHTEKRDLSSSSNLDSGVAVGDGAGPKIK